MGPIARADARLEYLGQGHKDKDGRLKGWAERHRQAIDTPTGREYPFVGLIRSWLRYAEYHQDAYESSIGEDGYTGPEWAKIGAALRRMLSCDMGRRLDGGTLDGVLCNALKDQDFDPDEF